MRRLIPFTLGLLPLGFLGCDKPITPLGPAQAYSHPKLLDGFKADPTQVDLNLVFLHHSCGSNLLAAHNGGLDKALSSYGFKVHDATYGSKVGQETDVIHWVPKFTTMMDAVLKTKKQDDKLPDGQTNQVVLFKSCYPNSHITGKDLATVANFKLVYKMLLPLFAKHPKVLFVALTAPPLRKEDTSPDCAKRALEFNQWLVGEWAKGHKNVIAFDLFGVLRTKEGYLNYPTQDSHPSKEGNRLVTKKFIPFIFKALRRLGLVK